MTEVALDFLQLARQSPATALWIGGMVLVGGIFAGAFTVSFATELVRDFVTLFRGWPPDDPKPGETNEPP